VSSQGVKQAGCKADHSPPSSAKVKNEWSIPLPSYMHSWHAVDKLNYYLYYYHIQRNPVKTFLKIPRKFYFLSGKFLKRVGLKISTS
jgi:hypothetical protein